MACALECARQVDSATTRAQDGTRSASGRVCGVGAAQLQRSPQTGQPPLVPGANPLNDAAEPPYEVQFEQDPYMRTPAGASAFELKSRVAVVQAPGAWRLIPAPRCARVLAWCR